MFVVSFSFIYYLQIYIIKEMGEGGEQPTPKEKTDRWDYSSHFREYLLLLGDKRDQALESRNNYPYRIELGDGWHETHARMKDETSRDGKERLAIVGFRDDHQLVLPVTPAIGTEDQIPSNVIFEELHRAKVRAGIVDVVGRIHTHPSGSPFSATDLFSLLYEHFGPEVAMRLPKDQLPVTRFFTGVVTPNEVMYAFKTRETFPVRPTDMWPKDPLQFFRKYWFEKSGYEDRGEPKLKKLRPGANLWDISLGIAGAHNLVLYRGKHGEDLIRSYP